MGDRHGPVPFRPLTWLRHGDQVVERQRGGRGQQASGPDGADQPQRVAARLPRARPQRVTDGVVALHRHGHQSPGGYRHGHGCNGSRSQVSRGYATAMETGTGSVGNTAAIETDRGFSQRNTAATDAQVSCPIDNPVSVAKVCVGEIMWPHKKDKHDLFVIQMKIAGEA